jgi:uncharacterized heparinase superfamily protein
MARASQGLRTNGLAIRPRDPRPADATRGAQLLAGVFQFGGEAIEVGPGGDPWGRRTPGRRFAAALHGFDWTRDLLATGEAGGREALRLWQAWRAAFGRGNGFGWSGGPLERRVLNLVCAAPALAPLVSDAEGAAYIDALARQARRLAEERGDPARGAERAAVAALVGASLAGKPSAALLEASLKRLARLIPQAVLRDGVHASRSPQRGLELLFDLLALDDALSQRGAAAPLEVARGIDRLSAGVRFFTLGDGRLATFHGGEAASAARVAAALALDADAGAPARSTPYGGYHRLERGGLQVIVDAGPTPEPVWSGEACAQLGALAAVVDGRPLILASAWSATADADAALRGPPGGSCLQLAEAWPDAELRPRSFAGGTVERLEGGPTEVKAERREADGSVWLDMSHAGWEALGLAATRRLYLDAGAGDLRGEDSLAPVGRPRRAASEFTLRFHLAADVAAQLSGDGRSALLRPPGGAGWRLRSDAESLRLAHGLLFEDGAPRAGQVLLLTGLATPAEGARVRWRLSRDIG